MSDIEKADDLLCLGCAIPTFNRSFVTKRTSLTEKIDYEYRLHPILTPFFGISYRDKRKISIDASLLLESAQSLEGYRNLIRMVLKDEQNKDYEDLFGRP